MNRKKSTIFMYILFGFATLGLIYAIFKEPGELIRSVLTGAAIIGIIYFIFTRFKMGNSSDGYQAYRKAARKTAKKKRKNETVKAKRSRHNPHGFTVISKEQILNKPKQKSEVKLTVIEGKKARKKNRAFF